MPNNLEYLLVAIIVSITAAYAVKLRLQIKEVRNAYNNLSLAHEILKRSVKDIPLTYMPNPKEDVKPLHVYKVFRPSTAPPTDLYCPQEFIVTAESIYGAVSLCMNHYDLDEWWTAGLIPDRPQIITVVEKL